MPLTPDEITENSYYLHQAITALKKVHTTEDRPKLLMTDINKNALESALNGYLTGTASALAELIKPQAAK